MARLCSNENFPRRVAEELRLLGQAHGVGDHRHRDVRQIALILADRGLKHLHEARDAIKEGPVLQLVQTSGMRDRKPELQPCNHSEIGYYRGVIVRFADKETQKVFRQEFSKKLPRDIQISAYRKLLVLDALTHEKENRFHPQIS